MDTYIDKWSSKLTNMSDEDRQDLKAKHNTVYEFNIKDEGQTSTFHIDLKRDGTIYKGKQYRADVLVTMSNHDFVQLAKGNLHAQKAYMSGKIKIKGNIMGVTKMDDLIKHLNED
ncbi:SCP2 sterol-binding domain-containing protein [Aspergillus ambiguus]|uniref:SCP2 sterol-binding domain-containing protein n=1 Tax=Aspergillus ambiguus TaxID=176160 RepID=UPI003CCCDD94